MFKMSEQLTHKLMMSSRVTIAVFCAEVSGVRSYPIRCLVEEENQDSNGNVLIELSTTVLCDTFAILPGSLLFSDILRGALVKIGFSVLEAIGAKGEIDVHLLNWNESQTDKKSILSTF